MDMTPKQAAEQNRLRKQQNSRFQRGSGCYTCKSCGKKTRKTGDGAELGLCNRCYEMAGDENAVADGQMTQEEFNQKWGQ
jgi:ribosome-binding protein aMBF1 (putative translation factor)